jgi:hypothetical protein
MRSKTRFLVATVLGAIATAGLPARKTVAAEADFFIALQYAIDSSVRGCPSEAEFRKSVVQQLGDDPFHDDASLSVVIRVGGSARAVNGQVDWRSESGKDMGERRFLAKDGNCSNLLTEIGFAVALQIQLLRTTAPAEKLGTVSTQPKPLNTEAPAPAALPPARPAPNLAAPVPERRENADLRIEPGAAQVSARWPMWLGMGPSLALGVSPSMTTSARLFFGARRNNLSQEVGAEASLPSTARQTRSSGFRQSLFAASAAVCAHRHAILGCALGKVGQVRVSGYGVDQPRSAAGVVGQAGLRLAAAMNLGGPWIVSVRLDVLALLTPFTVELNQVEQWKMPRLGALAGIDLSARFR